MPDFGAAVDLKVNLGQSENQVPDCAATKTTLLTPIAQLSFSHRAQQLCQCRCASYVYEQCVAAPLLWKGKVLAVSQLVIQPSLIGAEGPDSDDALHLLPVVARY